MIGSQGCKDHRLPSCPLDWAGIGGKASSVQLWSPEQHLSVADFAESRSSGVCLLYTYTHIKIYSCMSFVLDPRTEENRFMSMTVNFDCMGMCCDFHNLWIAICESKSGNRQVTRLGWAWKQYVQRSVEEWLSGSIFEISVLSYHRPLRFLMGYACTEKKMIIKIMEVFRKPSAMMAQSWRGSTLAHASKLWASSTWQHKLLNAFCSSGCLAHLGVLVLDTPK